MGYLGVQTILYCHPHADIYRMQNQRTPQASRENVDYEGRCFKIVASKTAAGDQAVKCEEHHSLNAPFMPLGTTRLIRS